MTEIEEDILLLDQNLEDIILHRVSITGKTITTIEVTTGNQNLEVHPACLSGDPQLHPDHPVGIEIGVSCRHLSDWYWGELQPNICKIAQTSLYS